MLRFVFLIRNGRDAPMLHSSYDLTKLDERAVIAPDGRQGQLSAYQVTREGELLGELTQIFDDKGELMAAHFSTMPLVHLATLHLC